VVTGDPAPSQSLIESLVHGDHGRPLEIERRAADETIRRGQR
jgi:hypothetical protein